MRTLYLDMPSGIAGDMLLAALLHAGGDRERLERDLTGLGCGAIPISATPVLVGGLSALRVEVEVDQRATWEVAPTLTLSKQGTRVSGHSTITAALPPVELGLDPPGHRPYRDIRALLERAPLLPRVKTRAQAVFRHLAEAEAAVHGVEPETVGFHEVGALDAIADVVGCCLLLEQLGVERIVAGPLLPGHGTVACAHGRMPVPVPAVARMLTVPALGTGTLPPWRALGRDTGELTTPTGAALVCALADAFLDDTAPSPILRALATGYGAGHKTIPGLVNACRVMVTEPVQALGQDTVEELRLVVDDASGEELAEAIEALRAGGALDAWLVPILMKKGRPGHELVLLARPAEAQRLADLALTLTPSIGVRRSRCQRQVLERSAITVEVGGHALACKVVTLPDGQQRMKPEADAVRAVATALGWTPARVRHLAQATWQGLASPP